MKQFDPLSVKNLLVPLWRVDSCLSAEGKESVDGEIYRRKIIHTYWLAELFLA